MCNGEDLLKHIHHIKVYNESEKGLSLTDVCRISMRTRDLLDRSVQWLDSAMAELHLQAKTAGRVTDEEFINVLRPFTEGVLSAEERHTLFTRLDGENKGYVSLDLTEAEYRKVEELKSMRKTADVVTKVNHAISAIKHKATTHQTPKTAIDDTALSNVDLPKEFKLSPSTVEPSTDVENIEASINTMELAKDSEVASSTAKLTNDSQADFADDAELQELECRLQELRKAQSDRLRRRRKRELQAEIEALQRELEAKTPKASTPQSTCTTSKVQRSVSFSLPSTLTES